MKSILLVVLTVILILGCSQTKSVNSNSSIKQKMDTTKKYNPLTPEEERVIINKGTERAYSGEYENFKGKGYYLCKRCDAKLYKSDDKFDSGCGWPSFDDEIPGAVTRIPDKDGMRTEIICSNCGAHLGHVFLGEGFTQKDTRHCVNSISLKFIPYDKMTDTKTDTAYFAGGCFWGVQYLMENTEGVIKTTVGYIGGHKDNPTYEQVCSGTTGHAEALEVIFDPSKVTYEKLTKLFFEIHDFTQVNRQGPDVGEQYRSGVFYLNDEQKKAAENVVSILSGKGYKVATEITKANKFWRAEDYHQKYYDVTGKQPYCHVYKKIFD
ncbi:MAG: bifunctional methionine sulfoxide reductase B/A protein [Ignavibacteria bacterium]|nr:bifunctional methionine sulfoxide reductase B/A protein [Ignavibacteria bacterium]